MNRGWLAVMWVGVCMAAVCLHAANLYLGELNQDEGWYLYAARLVHQGQLPYVDFATTQGPVMPLVYSLVDPFVQVHGVAGGRLFTALLGLLAAGLAAATAARLAGQARSHAALMAFAMTAVNVYQNYYCTVVKTYALAACLLMVGFLALTWATHRFGSLATFAGGILLATAAATRTSAVVAVAGGFLYLLGAWRQVGWLRVVWFSAGAGLALAAWLVPFYWVAPDSLWFALWEYHAGRQAGNLMTQLAYKAGFLSRLVQAYFVAVCILVSAVVGAWACRRPVVAGSRPGPLERPASALWLTVLFLTAVHGLTPFPYDDYQVIAFPVLAAALSAWVVGLCGAAAPAQGGRLVGWVTLVVVLLTTAGAVSSPINQDWFVGRRDRIWWPLKDETPLAKLGRAAELVRSLTGPDDVLLTQDPYLAVEAGRALPHGLELGQFSYFPDWPRDKAERCHVLNAEMLRECLDTSRVPLAAFSGYGFAIRSPAVLPLAPEEQTELWRRLENRYYLFRNIPDFGQAATTLKIYLLAE